MGPRGPGGPNGKNGDDVSDLLIISFPVYPGVDSSTSIIKH